MRTDHPLIKPVLGLLLGTGLSKGFQFVFILLAARFLSLEDFGIYSISLTLMIVLLSPLLVFGSDLLVTSYSANNDDRYYHQAMVWRLAVFPFAALVLIGLGRWIYGIDLIPLLLASALILTRSVEQNVLSAIRGKGKNLQESFYLGASRAAMLAALIVSAVHAGENLQLGTVLIIQIAGTIGFLPFLTRRQVRLLPEKPDRLLLKKLLAEGFPLAISSLTWIIYFKVDVLMVGKLVGTASAGLYEFAYKILEAFFIFPSVIMIVFFRRLAASQDLKTYRQLFTGAALLLLAAGILFFAFSQWLVPPALHLFLRAEQIDSIDLLRVLSFAIPFVFLGYLSTQVLVIQKQRKLYMAIMVSGAIFNVILNLILIPKMGAGGAALSTVISEALILVLSAAGLFIKFGNPFVPHGNSE